MKTKAIVFISTGISLLLSACSSSPAKKNINDPVNVTVHLPTEATGCGVSISGQVTAKQTATISTRIMGHVQTIYVKPGDKVNAGQLLLSLNANDIKAKQQQLEAMKTEATAAEKKAQKDFERFSILRNQNSVSEKEFDNVELHYTSMKAKLQMAEEALKEINAQLSYANITAPFSGNITQKMIDEGSMANPGMPLLILEQAGEFIIQASVPENHIQNVKVGDKVNIEISSVNKALQGRIVELSPSAYNTGGQFLIKVAPEESTDKSIQPGMFASITINNEKERELKNTTLLVDNSSLVYRDQLTGIYVANKDGLAILKWVRLGKENQGKTEVISGLNHEDLIILSAEGKLYNGKSVIISNKQK